MPDRSLFGEMERGHAAGYPGINYTEILVDCHSAPPSARNHCVGKKPWAERLLTRQTKGATGEQTRISPQHCDDCDGGGNLVIPDAAGFGIGQTL